MKPFRTVAVLSMLMALAGGVFAPYAGAQNPYLLGWGLNGDGQSSPVPTNVMENVDSFSAGHYHSLAAKNGQAWAWGSDARGQSTVPIAAQSDVATVSAGGDFSLALKTDGGVVTWGTPTLVTNVPGSVASGVSQISAGEWHALALKDGGVIAWGSNTYGQSSVPVELSNGVSSISAGGTFSMALKDGAVHVFGISAGHALEYGVRAVPAEASNGVTAISAGTYHALALKDGGVLAWGASFFDATNVPPEAASDVVAITAGDQTSIALKSDGSLVMWGAVGGAEPGGFGLWPVPVFAASGVGQIEAGRGHCLARAPLLPPRILSADLPFGYLGYPYVGSITAIGDPGVSYAKFGTWPNWMTLDPATGAVGGTPTTNISYSFSVVVSNTVGTATGSYSVTVFAELPVAPVFVTESPLPDGTVGVFYSKQIVASNSPVFRLSDVGNPLPQGLSLSTNGLISGTPTAAYDTKFIRIIASNMAGTVYRDYDITVLAPSDPPVFVTESPLPEGMVGQPYSLQIEASNSPSFSLFSGALPSGLVLDAAGMITGTPTVVETATFTVRASNGGGSSNRVYELAIHGPPEFSTTSPLPGGTVGVSYSQQIVATGNPTFSLFAGALPGGLNLSAAGLVSGTPNAPGAFSFTVRAQNSYGWNDREFSVSVIQLPVFSTTNPLPNGRLTNAYSVYIVASGSPTYTNVGGALPGGMRLIASGRLFGVPTNTGSFTFTVRATNVYGFTDKAYDLTIEGSTAEPPRFTLVAFTNGGIRMAWTNPNASGNVVVWRATNLATNPVSWSNLGVQASPYTNEAPPTPSYYQLRLVP